MRVRVKQNHFSLFIGGPDGFDSWNKKMPKNLVTLIQKMRLTMYCTCTVQWVHVFCSNYVRGLANPLTICSWQRWKIKERKWKRTLPTPHFPQSALLWELRYFKLYLFSSTVHCTHYGFLFGWGFVFFWFQWIVSRD